jgi:membrane protein DedA with SNARE-associated domain/membrane-associated phospholipid phosphatase
MWLVAATAVAASALVRRRRMGRTSLAASVALVVALAAYGAGLFDLPNVEELLTEVGARLGAWTYLLVGLGAFLETGAFVGLVAPGESLIIFGGFVAGQGRIDLGLLLALVWLTALAGDTVSFFLGRRLGRDFLVRHGPKVKITSERLAQVEAFFARHGGKTILIGRFVGIVRAVAPFLAGASRMPYSRFWPYDVLGAGLYSAVFVLLGYVFWRSFDQVVELAGRGTFAVGTVIVLVVGAFVAYRRLRDPERRAETFAWVERQPALRRLGRATAPVRHHVRRPASWLWSRLTPGELGLELTTMIAVFAVGAFVFMVHALALRTAPATAADITVLRTADELRVPATLELARAVAALGTLAVSGAVVAVVAGLLALRGHPLEAVVLVAGLALTVLAVQVAQAFVDRDPPLDPLAEVAPSSFPATHAAYAVAYPAVAIALARGVPPLAGRFAVVTVALALAAAVGLARVYLRAHFPSDVLGGFGLAAAAFALCGAAGLLVAHVGHNGVRHP